MLVVLSSHMAKYILLFNSAIHEMLFCQKSKKHLSFVFCIDFIVGIETAILLRRAPCLLLSVYRRTEHPIHLFIYVAIIIIIYLFIWPCETGVCVAPLSECREPSIKRMMTMIFIMMITQMMVMMMMIYILC